MAGEKHLKLTIFGDYTPSSVDAPEVWACNLREALVFGSVDDTGTFPSNWDVTPVFDTHTETDWTTETTYGIDGPLTATFDPESYLTDYVGPTLQGWMGGAGFSDKVRLLGAALYPCGTNGNAIGSNVARLTYTNITTGSATGNMLPTENSLAVSWQTHVLGPKGRGRIFPPPSPSSALTAYGVASSGYISTWLNAHVNTIEGLSYSGTGGATAHVRVVVTGPNSVSPGSGYLHYGTIIGARVGQVFDTQRRRRNKLPEAYSADTITQV